MRNITPLRCLYALLILTILGLQAQMWLGHATIPGIVRVRAQLDQVQLKNQQADQRNQAMYAHISALKDEGQAVEAKARYDLGMIKQGEVFYQVYEEKHAHTSDE